MLKPQGNIMERLAKAISSRGFCSRRDAEKLIAEGKVKVNGKPIMEVVTFVTPEDTIEVDNVKLFESKPRLWVYYKPRGLVTTHKDPQGRPTVFDNIPLKIQHIISVGRLDIDSEGLLLLTNNGELARKFELPSNNFARVYKVKAYGRFRESDLNLLEQGVVIDGVEYRECRIEHIKSNQANHWFWIEIYEGKNREVRRLFEYIGLTVNRLIRTHYHTYSLDDMEVGDIREVEIISRG